MNIQPVVRAEFEDRALLTAFGHKGVGLFFVPQIIRKEVERDYHVEHIGDVESIK